MGCQPALVCGMHAVLVRQQHVGRSLSCDRFVQSAFRGLAWLLALSRESCKRTPASSRVVRAAAPAGRRSMPQQHAAAATSSCDRQERTAFAWWQRYAQPAAVQWLRSSFQEGEYAVAAPCIVQGVASAKQP